MTSATVLDAAHPTAISSPPRIVSIDIFRGLTMAVMIFVNELSDVRGLPWWTYHAHAQQDVMTYVDMVFPFFLFIVGMSMPLSVEQRLRRNASALALWGHVIARVIALVVLGLILANADYVNAALTHMTGSVWALLGIVCAGLYLNVYPKSASPLAVKIARAVGFLGVVAAFILFRRVTHDGQVGVDRCFVS